MCNYSLCKRALHLSSFKGWMQMSSVGCFLSPKLQTLSSEGAHLSLECFCQRCLLCFHSTATTASRGRWMEAALRLSGSFPQRHLETASQETPSSTPPGRPAFTKKTQTPPVHPRMCQGNRFLPHSPWINGIYSPVICLFWLNFRYRRALSNNCTEGASLRFSPRRQRCPSRAPRGLQLLTSEGMLVATLGRNVTFLVFLEEVLTSVLHTEQPCLAPCLFNQSLQDIVDLFNVFFCDKSAEGLLSSRFASGAGPACINFLFVVPP